MFEQHFRAVVPSNPVRDFLLLAALVSAALLAGCGSDSDADGTTRADSGAPTDDAGGASDGSGATPDSGSGAEPDVEPEPDLSQYPEDPATSVGGDRPAPVTAPSDYDPAAGEYPLVVLLHGFGASGLAQDFYLGVTAQADALQFIAVVPDGTVGPDGSRFWNGTSACCNFGGNPVDDVAYITGLVEEVSENYRIDAGRVYLFGHSNGGFMSYRLSCEASEVFAAMASLAGASFASADQCQPASTPVSVLQIHGTADETIDYEGGRLGGVPTGEYPSARESAEMLAELNGCDLDAAVEGPALDLEVTIEGAESTSVQWTEGCLDGSRAELWTIPEGSHIPALNPEGTIAILQWLLEVDRTP